MRNYQPNWDSDDLEADADPILREAVFWHEMLNMAEPSEAARREFETWLQASPEHGKAYSGIAAIWQAAVELPHLTALRSRKKQVAMTRRGLMMGGLGLLGVSGGRFWLSGYPFADIRVEKGALHREVLPDGSRLEVAGRGALSIDFTPSGRRIFLHRGDVFFDMARDVSRPFEVVAGASHVVGDHARFSLATGRTEIVLTVAEEAVTLRPGDGRSLVIGAGEQAIFDGATTQVAEADLSSTLAWRNGRLVYVSQPMSRIIEGVNRWSRNEIVIVGANLARREATLILDLANIDEALDHLRQAVPMRIIDAPAGMVFIV